MQKKTAPESERFFFVTPREKLKVLLGSELQSVRMLSHEI